MFDVFFFDSNERLGVRHVYAFYLAPAGNSWTSGKHVAIVSRLNECGLVWQAWSRANETHIAEQHVHKLRKLVDPPTPKKRSNSGNV